MTITDWPLHERPRERLLAHGAERLSDAELLAIFLRTGYRGRTALDLARELLAQFESLSGIVGSSPEKLCAAPGLGQAKVAQLLATVELSRRALGETLATRNALTSPNAVKDFLRLSLASKEHEVFVAVFLDAQHRVICSEEMFRGSLTQTSVYPREVVKASLKNNAAAIIFAHNHLYMIQIYVYYSYLRYLFELIPSFVPITQAVTSAQAARSFTLPSV